MPFVSIILPTYNEAANIEQMVDAVNDAVGQVDAEIIVVDDDSPDGTSAVVQQLTHTYPRLQLITRTGDKGLIKAIKEGVSHSKGDVCVWMDADMSMPASTIPRLLKEIEQGNDMAIGSRYVAGGGVKGSHPDNKDSNAFTIWRNLKETEDSFLAVAISKYGNVFAQTVLDSRYCDYTSGFYAVKKHVIDDVGLEGKYLDYCISLLYKTLQRGYKVSEIPVVIVPRLKGKSKTSNNPFSMIPIALDCVLTVFKLRLMEKRKERSDHEL